jgi:outer membrane protein TolC
MTRLLFRSLLIVGVTLAATCLFEITARADEEFPMTDPGIRRLRLDECIFTALYRNRELQIERLTPAIAQSYLSGAYGYYDPLITAEVDSQDAQDTGGLDPENFSNDAVFSAESEIARGNVTGFLPWGMNYDLFSNYAHSEGFRNGLNFDSYSLRAGVVLRQPLLRNFWIDQGRMTIQVNKRQLKITELGVHYVAMDVINRVQQAYYELAYAVALVRQEKDFLALREQLLASVQRRIEMGNLTVLEERLAAARVATSAATLAAAENAAQLAENELKTLVGDNWTDSTGVRIEPADPLLVLPQTFTLQESWQMGLARRPDLAQLREDVAKARIDLKYRRNQLFPALDIVASHMRRGSSTEQFLPPLQPSASFPAARSMLEDNDAPTDLIGVIFSVPLGLSTERANFRASKQLKQQAELRVKQYEELVMRQIADALQTAQAQYQRVTLTRRARELSEAALEAENQKLTGGKSTLYLVLELQNDFAMARTAELRAKADYNIARSQLRFAEATLLEHWKFAVELR